MKLRLRCIQVNLATFINPHDGTVVNNSFALFEGRAGEALKFNLSKEELEKLKVTEEYNFELDYSEATSIHLPS